MRAQLNPRTEIVPIAGISRLATIASRRRSSGMCAKGILR